MLHLALNYKAYKNVVPKHIFLISFLVFITLNVIENVYHYSIGRLTDKQGVKWVMPTRVDWIHIIVVMVIFGILQGLFTCLLIGC